MTSCEFSTSIGIACCPQDGTRFEDLFRHSDLALYDAKSRGKNGYSLYEHSLSEQGGGFPGILPAANTRIDSNEEQGKKINDLIEQIIQKICEEKDLETAVDSILKTAGRHFGVSRAYIFEKSEKGCANTFEWCSRGIRPLANIARLYPMISLKHTARIILNENGCSTALISRSFQKNRRKR